MSVYTVNCVIATSGTLPNGGGSIPAANYTITPDFTTLPTGFMSADTKGHFTASFTKGSNGSTLGPLGPGDKVNFVFKGTGITVTDVTRPPNYAFVWTKTKNTDNSFTLTGVVTGAASNIDNGGDNFEYTIALTISGNNYTIDPDFETDVGDAPTLP